jgi:hypothetical protein
LSGEAGCGKTQLCLTLALQVQLDLQHGGRDGAAAYLSCGEGTFPIRRLSQMAQAFAVRTGLPQERLLSNVHIEHCYNIDDAQTILVGLIFCPLLYAASLLGLRTSLKSVLPYPPSPAPLLLLPCSIVEVQDSRAVPAEGRASAGDRLASRAGAL